MASYKTCSHCLLHVIALRQQRSCPRLQTIPLQLTCTWAPCTNACKVWLWLICTLSLAVTRQLTCTLAACISAASARGSTMIWLLPRHIRRVVPGHRRHAHERPIEHWPDSKGAREGELGLGGEVLQPLVLWLVLLLVLLVLVLLQGPIIAKAPPVVNVLAGDGPRSIATLHSLRQSACWRWAAAGLGVEAVVHTKMRACARPRRLTAVAGTQVSG